jgi:plasmid replication initiation protein
MNTDEKALVVRQSNELIEASYKIASIGEGRLIRMLIAQITPDDEDFKTYRIGATDFAYFFGLSKESNSVYELIKKSADELAGRRIMLEKDGSWLRLNWLSYAEYKKGSGYIEVRFDKALKPYLLGLKGYFTQYELDKVITFKSGYTMRLFELLKKEQFKASGDGYFKRSFEYDEFRSLVGVDKTEYREFSDFRKRVIDSSVKEINANPDINVVNVEYPKTGRKVSHIVFHCERPRQLQLDVDEPPPKFEEVTKEREHPEDVRDLIAMGIDEATAYKWRKKYGVIRLTRNLAYTRAMQKAEKIRDSLTGFLARAIADNLGSAWEEEEKQRRAVIQAKNQVEAQKRTEEEGRALQDAERRAVLLHEFDTLSPEEKERVRSAYIEQATDIVRSVWEKAKKSLPDAPETDKRVLVSFLSFFSKWRETGMVTG